MRYLYSILGVSHRANAAEIKAAYRIKGEAIPDLHADDKEAENRVQDINHSYAVLSDSRARAAYDFKRILARMRTRRRGAAVAAAVLAVSMITATTISVEWRREAASPPLALNVNPGTGQLVTWGTLAETQVVRWGFGIEQSFDQQGLLVYAQSHNYQPAIVGFPCGANPAQYANHCGGDPKNLVTLPMQPWDGVVLGARLRF